MKEEKIEDIPYEFWKKYFEADELDKDSILEPIVKGLDVSKLPKELRKHCITTSLKGYLMDIEEYFIGKENEKVKK